MNDGNAKQQIVDKIKSTSNILVTVSSNPSVDELSAALGLTLLLNKMSKHATAVFSGAIPPAITFLDPQKTFENTVDSLRDFIIALDKEKADHLRYKVDGDVVKIFITPYRTTISSDDLDFSQGDYNVELVLALGVKDRDDLDGALAAHGRILHDATVVTMEAGDLRSDLGSLDWNETNASSLSEMLVSLSDGLKTDKALLDEQIATAFLTGIVAATDRFSNNKTSSKVMTMAAQLMSAGANQQLIASKLEEAHEIGQDKTDMSGDKGENSDGTTDLSEGESTKLNKKSSKDKKSAETPKKKEDDGALTISHEKEGDVDEVAKQAVEEGREEATTQAQEDLKKQSQSATSQQEIDAAKAEDKLAQQLSSVAPAAVAPAGGATPSVADLKKDLAAANAEMNADSQRMPEAAASPLAKAAAPSDQAPSMGGTLNATTEQAEEEKRREQSHDRNHTILTHNSGNNYVGDSEPIFQSPINATVAAQEEPPLIDSFKETTLPPAPAPTQVPTIQPPAPATLADLDKQNRAPHEDARAAVNAAFGAVPFSPANNPAIGLGAQPLGGEIQHDQPAPTATQLPAATLPPMPPLPDFSTLPPLPQAPEAATPSGALPPEKLEDLFGTPAAASAPTAPPKSTDPGQFKIPGQS
jgi:hypothetical protein